MYKSFSLSLVASILIGSASIVDAKIIDLTKKQEVSNLSSKYGKNEVIILFKDGAKIPDYFKDVISKFTYKKFNIVNAMYVKSSTLSTDELIKLFKSDKFSTFIESVEANYAHKPFKSNDTYYNKLWAFENKGQEVNSKKGTVDADMDVAEAWQKEKGSHDVIVAVLDTGVDYRHDDLSDNMYIKLSKHGYDFAGDDDGNNDDDPMPDKPYDEKGHYHGTHVAGIIGAVGNNSEGVSGVSQNVQILAVKVFRPKGYAYTNDILEGLDYVAKRIDAGDNIVAINASYGGGGGSQDDATNKAIKNLGKKGVVFCAAAGNDGKDIDKNPTYPASYDAKNIITVAASDQDDKLASFSNYGKDSVDVAAPGTNILSTYPDNQYAYLQGTSMATPEVTGLVALIKAHNPSLSVNDVIKTIKSSVDKKNSFKDKVASNGRVNANDAIKYLDDGGVEKNNPPVANDDSAKTEPNKKVTIDVLSNDSDIDGDSIKIVKLSTPSHGSVKIVNSKVEYTPNKDYEGDDSFNYTISDSKGAKASAKVSITVKKSFSLGDFFGGIFGGLFN